MKTRHLNDDNTKQDIGGGILGAKVMPHPPPAYSSQQPENKYEDTQSTYTNPVSNKAIYK